ncbi:MAG: hypothetical protein HZC17_02530 [Candidatus Omnitrophica bacterium]|nr:hypothetical protein [Candidatus Omnitrophota bacterium]
MNSKKIAAILFTGDSCVEKASYVRALQEVLSTNGLNPVVIEEVNFPFLSAQLEPEWSRGVLQTAFVLTQRGYFVLLPIQLNDAESVERARGTFPCFKEVYFKTGQEGAGLRKPKLPELMIQSDFGDFDKNLKQILDWMEKQKMIEKRAEMVASSVSSQEADVIREKLKSLGYL